MNERGLGRAPPPAVTGKGTHGGGGEGKERKKSLFVGCASLALDPCVLD